MAELDLYTTAELEGELQRRADRSCVCGIARRGYTAPGDETFHPRTGCLACDKWDGNPQLRNP